MTEYDDIVLRDFPIHYVPLDDTSGTTASALVGVDGTYSGSPTLDVTGPTQVGSNGISSDGTDDYCSIVLTNLGTGQAQSFEFWADAASTINTSTTSQYAIGSTTTGLVIGFGSFTGDLTNEVAYIANIPAGAGDYTGFSGFTIPSGWHHHCFVYTGTQGEWTYYLDGVDTGSRENASGGAFGLADFTTTLMRYSTFYAAWDGYAAFAAYDYDLLPSAVAQHAAASPPAFKGLLELDLPAGCDLYLPLDGEDSDTNNLYDRVSNQSGATKAGGGAVHQKIGPTDFLPYAMEFNASGERGRADTAVGAEADMTIEGWVLIPSSLPSAHKFCFGFTSDDASGGTHLMAVSPSNKFRGYVWDGGNKFSPESSVLVVDTWYYTVMTIKSGDEMELFVDGVSIGTTSVGTTDADADEFRVGSRSGGTGRMTVQLSGCGYYTRALSADEIIRRYKLAKGLALADGPVRY